MAGRIPVYPTPGLRPILGGVIGGSTPGGEEPSDHGRAVREAARLARKAREAQRELRRAARARERGERVAGRPGGGGRRVGR